MTSTSDTSIKEHLTEVRAICERCSCLKVKGHGKLLRKCEAELRFLESLSKRSGDIEAQLKSSNLRHLAGLIEAAEQLSGVTHVLQTYSNEDRESLTIDLICNEGYAWVKVIARQAQALHLVYAGGGHFGERSVVSQADTYLSCAQQHKFNYVVPTVTFVFLNGVTSLVKEALEARGVVVKGKELEVSDSTRLKLQHDDEGESDDDINDDLDEESGNDILSATEYMARLGVSSKSAALFDDYFSTISSSDSSETKQKLDVKKSSLNSPCDTTNVSSVHPVPPGAPPDPVPGLTLSNMRFSAAPTVSKVNLDISTLISLVSNLCHGFHDSKFREPVLRWQAKCERERPLLAELQEYLKDKEILVCETAAEAFSSILNTVGGPQEKERAKELMARVKVIADQPSAAVMDMQLSAKVKHRAKVIFGTGESRQAVTVTANSGFVRAAHHQGVDLAVHLHEPRVLSERKQRTE